MLWQSFYVTFSNILYMKLNFKNNAIKKKEIKIKLNFNEFRINRD